MIIWKKKETRPALEFLCLIEFCFLLMVFAEKLAYNEDPISFITKIENYSMNCNSSKDWKMMIKKQQE